MQKDDKSLYLIFLPVILILGGGIWQVFDVFNNQDHPSNIPLVILIIGGILGTFGGTYFFYKVRRGDSWPNRAQDICQRYQGTLKIIGNAMGVNSYAVDIKYRNCKFQFLDTYKTMIDSVDGHPAARIVVQDKILFRIPISTNLNIDAKTSTGSGLIGETVDFLNADGRKNIARNPLLNMDKNIEIYSDQENEAVKFLTDLDVKSIYLKYLDKCTSYSGYPIQIDKGYINFNFLGVESLRLKKNDDFNIYLDDLIVLSKKLQ